MERLSPLPAVRAAAPILSFDSPNQFARKHFTGTNQEFEFEKGEISKFNAAEHEFKAYPMITIREGRSSKTVLLFIEPKERDLMLPKEGEQCKVHVGGAGRYVTIRRENPCLSWGVSNHYWDKHLVFEITITLEKDRARIHSFFSGPDKIESGMEMPGLRQIRPETAVFELRVSSSTMEAEIGALRTVMSAFKEDRWHMKRKADALKYMMKFGKPAGYVDIFAHFPHMSSPGHLPKNVSPDLAKKMMALDSHQERAYKSLLCNIPDGIGILPGGPGAGKTHFNIVLVAALQSADERLHAGESSPRPNRNTVLMLCDINKTTTDIANKVHQMYRGLGLTRKDSTSGAEVPRVAVRMFCWSHEKTSLRRGRLESEWKELLSRVERGDHDPISGASGFARATKASDETPEKEKDESEEVAVHRLSLPFLKGGSSHAARTAGKQNEQEAPTLDQFVRADYERHKDTTYATLRDIIRGVDLEKFDRSVGIPFSVEMEIEKVYRNALRQIDFIAMTPVTASKFSSDLAAIFNPVLVIVNEAPHARELSTLTPIARFNPAAWLFTGDDRQTKPWVGSYGKRPNINEYAPQLRTSMMERAIQLKANSHTLMVNHRARGGLHELPSKLFYDNVMISAYTQEQHGWLPNSTSHLRDSYIMKMKQNNGPRVSRLIVVLGKIGPPAEEQSNWYHREHELWVMNLIRRLLSDPKFTKSNGKDRGTILVMSPYRAASIQYRRSIKDLMRYRMLDTSNVEARTVGTAQGNEADFVILDLVRDRLCVALTRARQAEIILMHERMLKELRSNWLSSYREGPLAEMLRHCEKAGEFVLKPASNSDVRDRRQT
ncbi:hypothetical protein Daus18300_005499 [Diaporthe australafricana]|uniref:DNA2/NAM7 helicase-like C-terminal domain-containing protein n=1 Tax=Diaporthe australafricana TaxID=127596 RepID=A0ABR3X1Z2_9PEZI